MILAIVGPTGVGKTKLSVELAKYYNGIIINADAVQIFKSLDIGSAKVREEEKCGIPHLLFDIKNPDEDYTVKNYQTDARKIIEEYKGKNIIFCGGTGLYLSAALMDYRFYEDEDTNTYVENYIPTITWKLQEGTNIIDYEHFTIPFIITMEKASEKIRNLRYRYMPSQTTLFPNEVDKYDINILRELLNNAIAHQDYRKGGRVNILEFKDKVMIINEGSFIPKTVDTLIINEGYVPPYYRNPFLAQAMVNLNMIDTAGMGIRRSFEKLRERFFPMPDYDLSEENRVKVTIYGKILDEQYSKLLLENTDLTLTEVMLLDRVQKNIVITKEQSDLLRKNKLTEGRYPNIYVSKSISEIVDDKISYINNSGFDDKYYKDLVLKYIDDFGSITKADLDKLLMSKLPNSLDDVQKKRKIKYLVNEHLQKKENIIKNIGTTRYPIWTRK